MGETPPAACKQSCCPPMSVSSPCVTRQRIIITIMRQPAVGAIAHCSHEMEPQMPLAVPPFAATASAPWMSCATPWCPWVEACSPAKLLRAPCASNTRTTSWAASSPEGDQERQQACTGVCPLCFSAQGVYRNTQACKAGSTASHGGAHTSWPLSAAHSRASPSFMCGSAHQGGDSSSATTPAASQVTG